MEVVKFWSKALQITAFRRLCAGWIGACADREKECPACYNASDFMAHIFPFRALRYDPQRVSLPSVVTQPYDKITPEMQEGYYEASPYNLVRIILGKKQTSDDEKSNVYSRAAGFFSDWRRQGVFLQDPQASVYVYSQYFPKPGTNTGLERRGLIALG